MVTRGGGNFSVMAASPRAFRVGPSESAETGGPCRAQERPGVAQEHGAGFNAREVPKLLWPGMPACAQGSPAVAHDQADRNARDRALSMGAASGGHPTPSVLAWAPFHFLLTRGR